MICEKDGGKKNRKWMFPLQTHECNMRSFKTRLQKWHGDRISFWLYYRSINTICIGSDLETMFKLKFNLVLIYLMKRVLFTIWRKVIGLMKTLSNFLKIKDEQLYKY